MTDKNYTIKTASPAEVSIMIDWAAEEGWNPGLHDADCYRTADPDGFLIGCLGNEPVAAISAVKYDDSFGFLGLFIVKPACRGKGYGLQIWKAGINRLTGCNIGLDGVVARQENYKKWGFKVAYRNIRYQGIGGGEPDEHDGIIKLSTLPFTQIESYDRPFFPANRSAFLKSWINQPDSAALGILQDGRLAGYGVMRKCRAGYKIGPLFADSPELAQSLFRALKSEARPDEPVYLDIPEVNPAAVSLAERHGMNVVFETARMYSGEQPDRSLHRVFGVTSFELG